MHDKSGLLVHHEISRTLLRVTSTHCIKFLQVKRLSALQYIAIALPGLAVLALGTVLCSPVGIVGSAHGSATEQLVDTLRRLRLGSRTWVEVPLAGIRAEIEHDSTGNRSDLGET